MNTVTRSLLDSFWSILMMIDQKWLVRLFAALPCFLGIAIAHAAEPMPPTTVCIDQTNCVNTQSSSTESNSGIKWHPGHYMQEHPGKTETQQTRFQHYDLISSNKNVVGVVVTYRWSWLEGSTRGDYAAGIALLRAEINKLKSLAVPKRFFLRLYDVGYGSAYPAADKFPTYLQSAGCLVETSATGGRTVWRRWNSTCMGYYIDMLKAVAKEFDNEPFFEGLYVFGETAANIADVTPSDYSQAANDAQFRRLALAAKNMFPKSNVVMPINWHSSTSATTSLMAYNKSIGVGQGNPDSCPTCEMWGDRALQGLIGGVDYRGKIPVIYSIEGSELGYNSVGRSGGYTAQEIYDFLNTKIRASHILWYRNMSTGTSEQRWDTGILPLINANPKPTYTTCPAVYASCNTN